MDKILDVLLWSVVAIAVIIFFSIIIIGDATYFRFLSNGTKNPIELATNIKSLIN